MDIDAGNALVEAIKPLARSTARTGSDAGLGGFGKTRLAVECARDAQGFDSVAFVALSDCNTADHIAERIRSALEMAASQEDPLAQVCAFLGDDDVLLVLDNFEQLVEAGTAMILDLLERLPRLRLLITSRRVLNVPGEHVRDEPVRERGLLVEQPNHLPLGHGKDPARGQGGRGGEADRLPGQRAFTEEIAAAQHSDHRLFA